MPDGFRVEHTALEGPVFADADGRTLYKWPLNKQRNGYSGEPPGIPRCFNEVLEVTAGLMSPYPPGIRLPDLDTRPSCTALWPPVLADDGATPVGKWTLVRRPNGKQQWAYKEQPLYTSVRDNKPGDVLGGTTRKYGGDSPANRVPIKPPPEVPPGFAVKTTSLGRLLTTAKNESVYKFTGDGSDDVACLNECLTQWRPVSAPALAKSFGEWSVLERSPGEYQWVFRDNPLYTFTGDQHSWSQQGSDVSGWQNVYTQKAPDFPASFTVQSTIAGDVLADGEGKTIYTYVCGDDSADQLACDHPDDTQVYRLAMCGGGDATVCQDYWPYVKVKTGERVENAAWSIINVNLSTGRKLAPQDDRGTRVWAYRDRPVYTFGADQKPGDVAGAGTGEWRGQRNGLKAFWLRDDFMEGDL